MDLSTRNRCDHVSTCCSCIWYRTQNVIVKWSEKLLQNLSQNCLLQFPKLDKKKESAVIAFIVFFDWCVAVYFWVDDRYCEFVRCFVKYYAPILKSRKPLFEAQIKKSPAADDIHTKHDDNYDDYSNNLSHVPSNAMMILIIIAMSKEVERMPLHWTTLATSA